MEHVANTACFLPADDPDLTLRVRLADLPDTAFKIRLGYDGRNVYRANFTLQMVIESASLLFEVHSHNGEILAIARFDE